MGCGLALPPRTQGAAKGASEIEGGSMPEDGDMPFDAAEDFLVWAACGTPE